MADLVDTMPLGSVLGPMPEFHEFHSGRASYRSKNTVYTSALVELFVALSYALGNSEAVKPTVVNGMASLITKNLNTALRNIRHPNKGLTLWIDSICIDQRDDTEKTSQVQQMTDIYSSAAIVLAWLGPRSIDSGVAIGKLDVIGHRLKEIEAEVVGPVRNGSSLSVYTMATLDMRPPAIKIGISSDSDIPVTTNVHHKGRIHWYCRVRCQRWRYYLYVSWSKHAFCAQERNPRPAFSLLTNM